MTPTLFHNPHCSTSRAVLASLESAGYQPIIVDYLKTGWTRPQLTGLLAAMGIEAAALLRRKEKLAAELGLLAHDVPADRILDAMLLHPRLVERPIVQTPLGVVLARPPERVWAVIPDGSVPGAA